MRTTTIFSVLPPGTGRFGGGVLLSPTFAQDAGPASVSAPRWLSIPEIHDTLAAAGYRDIEKIERERTQGPPMSHVVMYERS